MAEKGIEEGSIVVVMLGDKKSASLGIPDNFLAVVVEKFDDGNFRARTGFDDAKYLKLPGRTMINLGRVDDTSLTPKEALRSKFPDVIMNLVLEAHGLRRQVEELRKQVEELKQQPPQPEEIEIPPTGEEDGLKLRGEE